MKHCLSFLFCILFLTKGFTQPYPPSKKVNQVDNYFGNSISDPYRWLEDDESAETTAWVKAQNEVTQAYLNHIPFRDSLKARMTELWSYPRQSAPSEHKSYYYFYKNSGTQNQNVLYRRKGIKAKEELVLDPNFLSENGTTSLRFFDVSHDGKFAAFGTSGGGSDWTKIHILDAQTLREFSEIIDWVKFSGISWHKNGFYYSRYDEPVKGSELSVKNEYHKVYYHKVGTPQSLDELVYEDKSHALRNFGASVSEDEQFLFISGSEAGSGNDLIAKSLVDTKSNFWKIQSGFEYSYDVIDNLDKNLLILTNDGAPRKKLIQMTFGKDEKRTIIPETDDVLIGVTRAGNKLVANYMKDASSRLKVFSLEGKFENEIKLPTLCTVIAVNGNSKDSLLFISIASFTFPETVFMYNLNSGKMESYFSPGIKFKADDYDTRQIFYTSKDGTRIPIFIVAKKGLNLDGNNPTLLFGYGGFDISKTPEFITERLIFLEKGGVFAMPNLRGGGEYGEDWHKAGTKLQKQNVFDDFIAAAEYLIKEKYTSPQHLAIGGRSNGGLLVGAAMTQRPDLFRVALPAVGVMDMLRFHKFTIGWAWTGDYGSSDDSLQFLALKAYSPLHNIKEHINYPATLVTTADHDDRVVPAHSFKFIATLQEKQAGKLPVLIRIDTMAGHGSGKPVSKIIAEQSDIFSFLLSELGMKW